MQTKTKINDNERKILTILADEFHPDEWRAYSFGPLERITGLDRSVVRRACRSLRRKGFAEYERVLVNQDGEPAGAGYRATEAGAAFLTPCDVCGGRAVYEYNVEKDGSPTNNDDENTATVRECEQHYKESPKLNPRLL